MKKLVIGLKNIKGADKCISWLEPVPVVGNYHQVFFFLPTLTEKVLAKILDVNPGLFKDFRLEIFEALRSGKIEIYCITSPEVAINSISNYSIFPFGVKRANKEILTFNNEERTGYMSLVEKTDGYFEWNIDESYLQSRMTSNAQIRFSWQTESILDSLHGKPVALKVHLTAERWKSDRFTTDWVEIPAWGGSVLFVPPTTKVEPEKGLEMLVKRGEEDQPTVERPDWFSEVSFPPEGDLQKKLEEAEKGKTELEAVITDTKNQLQNLENLKWCLRLKGLPLEPAVDKVFEFLGIPLTKGRPGQEDRWLEVRGNKLPVEIKGHEKAASREDLRQIVDRTKDSINKEGKTAGILIENPYCEEAPSKRPASFDDKNDKIISGATAWDVALIDTLTLIEVVKDKMNGKEDAAAELIKKLLSSIGVVI